MKYLKGVIRRFIQRYALKEVVYHHNAYSQAGEDRVLYYLFYSLKISQPSYIDIGANKPRNGSNTYLYYLEGSRGVCIEPDPVLFSDFQKERPLDTCLNVAIGYDETREMELFIFDEPSVNTLSKKDADERISAGEYKHTKTIKVAVKRVEEIIDAYFSKLPDFISLDVEGVDFKVLQSFDFKKYPVPVWIVETVDYSPNPQKPKNTAIIEFMKTKGYFAYADTYLNTIFVYNDWFSKFK